MSAERGSGCAGRAASAADGEAYLWDRSGPVDEGVKRLEESAAGVRWAGGTVPVIEERRSAASNGLWKRSVFAAAAVLCLAACGVWLAMGGGQNSSAPAWQVTALSGSPRVGSGVVTAVGSVRAGEWVTTDASSRASLAVASIGHVTLEPDSRLRLLASREREHRVELARGKMSAFIAAPPRLFFVETPAALAVDLGCIYTMEVGEDGSGMLEVQTGLVELQRTTSTGASAAEAGTVSRVLAGMVCRIDGKDGPGVPRARGASAELVAAVGVLETASARGQAAGAEAQRAIVALTGAATHPDAPMLWHLLWRVDDGMRATLSDALARLVPAPEPGAPDGALDPRVMEQWWRAIAARH